MAKYPTFPPLFDECKTMSISFLSRHGYLSKPYQYKSGTVNWSRNGEPTGSISIAVNMFAHSPYIEFDYRQNDELVNYRAGLVSMPANIGKGRVWFFICPHTGKRCRKLYLIGKRFLHRSAFTGCMYEKQTYSHYARHLDRSFGKYFGSEKLYDEIYSKHFKKTYAGKPTKRYLRLLEKIRQSEQFLPADIERLMVS